MANEASLLYSIGSQACTDGRYSCVDRRDGTTRNLHAYVGPFDKVDRYISWQRCNQRKVVHETDSDAVDKHHRQRTVGVRADASAVNPQRRPVVRSIDRIQIWRHESIAHAPNAEITDYMHDPNHNIRDERPLSVMHLVWCGA